MKPPNRPAGAAGTAGTPGSRADRPESKRRRGSAADGLLRENCGKTPGGLREDSSAWLGLLAGTVQTPACRWEAGCYSYLLRRTRPVDHKGPMRSWLHLDNWSLRVRVTARDFRWKDRRRLERMAEELRDAHRRQTREGMDEWAAKWARYRAAYDDKKFQAFKALVPGLVPPKRTRKPKSNHIPEGTTNDRPNRRA